MTPLVLVPGMMCDARLFGPQIDRFSTERAVHVANIAGHDTVAALAAQVLHSAPERFALAGLSMGGIVAMEVLAQAPGRVERIALLDTNPKAETDNVAAMREPQIARVRDGDLTGVIAEMKLNYVEEGPDTGDILKLCMTMAVGLGPQVFVEQSRALLTRPDQCDTLRSARLPALILCGQEDRLCPPHRHELMADLIPGSVLRILPETGHLPTLERPRETNAAFADWLAA